MIKNLSWSWSLFVIQSVLLTKLLTLGILFLTATLRAVVVAKFLISFILALRALVVAKSVKQSISFLTSFILA